MKPKHSIFRLFSIPRVLGLSTFLGMQLVSHADDSFFVPLEVPPLTTWTNSLGMEFIVGLKPGFRVCRWETRVQDFRVYLAGARESHPEPQFNQTDDHPVVSVSWNQAARFCVWLTNREQAMGLIPKDVAYRLPTDREWTLMLGRFREPDKSPRELDEDANGAYTWGVSWPAPAQAGNYGPDMAVDAFPFTSPVGSFSPNSIGLFDLAGNVWEWCADWYSSNQRYRVLRGGSWKSESYRNGLATERHAHLPNATVDSYGFRCVLAPIDTSMSP